MAKFFPLVTALLVSVLPSGLSTCDYASQFCGSVFIPYPFGINSSCGLPDFRINCTNNSLVGTGVLPFLQIGTLPTPEVQILNFSTNSLIVNSTDLKAMPKSDQCRSSSGNLQFELPPDGPYVLSDNNFFVVVGCDSKGNISTDTYPANLSCNTGCYNQFTLPYCSPYACCTTALPPGSRYLDFSGSGISYADFPDVCGYSTVLSPQTFVLTESGIFGRTGHYGLNISWAIVLNRTQNCSTVNSTEGYACAENSHCIDVDRVPGYACRCNEGYKGDGYKDGLRCEDIDECLVGENDCEPPPLGLCTNTPGSYMCSCTTGLGDGRRGNCTAESSDDSLPVKTIVIVAVIAALVTLGVVLLVVGVLQAWARRRREAQNFRRNGGEQFMKGDFSNSRNQDRLGRSRLQATLFSPQELERATQNYSIKLGSGGFGTVYKGTLALGDRVVAVKKANKVQMDGEAIQQFINEILLLGQVTHPNIVELIGCCLHTAVPILVYEYIDNGTLAEHLQQVRNANKHLSWAIRLLIAKQSAEALAHLHNISPPIFHRDIKSANILLDRKYTPKIADFGASHLLPEGQTHQSVDALVFTVGYLDPEYYNEAKFTAKSDVYSFGVVLLELITALPPFFSQSSLAERCVAKGELKDLMDQSIVKGGEKQVISSVRRVAEVATRCLEREGRRRPSMRQVCQDLGKIEAKFKKAGVSEEFCESEADTHATYGDDEKESLLGFANENSYQTEKSSLELGRITSTTSSSSSCTQRSFGKSISSLI